MPLFSSIVALPARLLRLLVVAPLWTAIAASGCHSSSESTRQTHAESISPAKGDDTSLLASGSGGGSGIVTKASGDGPTSSSGSAQTNGQAGAATTNTPSVATRLTNFFTRKSTSDSLVLPRNDQDGDNATIDGSPEKTAANEF
jgi:hypothetical protein